MKSRSAICSMLDSFLFCVVCLCGCASVRTAKSRTEITKSPSSLSADCSARSYGHSVWAVVVRMCFCGSALDILKVK
ncbi:hypothetical protein QVD17_30226 [Tagetes erecta]|uniref:Secreted protein n=1 Tax=Tagetes erecta TaxID=13708 RepID=A0AAD8NN24_TARER|nr:hypothetical protein QVD17_30226 [Tagetes erecta]